MSAARALSLNHLLPQRIFESNRTHLAECHKLLARVHDSVVVAGVVVSVALHSSVRTSPCSICFYVLPGLHPPHLLQLIRQPIQCQWCTAATACWHSGRRVHQAGFCMFRPPACCVLCRSAGLRFCPRWPLFASQYRRRLRYGFGNAH